tara:strand:+ start:7446 stop:7664 length:219 start_codon:yes stop_codon:yes gene_type:complete
MNMSWDYKKMTRLATFVASGVEEYGRQSVEMMVEVCGWQTAFNFYVEYEKTYHADCSQQREWIVEIKDREEE